MGATRWEQSGIGLCDDFQARNVTLRAGEALYLPAGWWHSGKGVKEWPVDKVRYEGDWERGKHHGFGVKKFTDGTTYEGPWYYGKPHGAAILYWSDGRVFNIEFEYGKFKKLMQLWESVDAYRGWLVQSKIEANLEEDAWNRMTLEQLEDVGEDNDASTSASCNAPGLIDALPLSMAHQSEMDHDDNVRNDGEHLEIVEMSSARSRTSSTSRASSRRSRLSKISTKLEEMGFSPQAAAAALEEVATTAEQQDEGRPPDAKS